MRAALLVADLQAFLGYLRRPVRTLSRRPDAQGARRRLALAVVAIGLADLIVAVPISTLASALEMKNLLDNMAVAQFLIVGVLLAPGLEEIVFRAGLRSPGYTLFAGPAILLLVTSIGSWPSFAAATAFAVGTALIWKAATAACQRIPGLRARLSRHYLRRYPWVFYLYALTFGLLHAGNWEWAAASGWVAVPALLLPQFYFGLVAGYLRIRDGLASAIFLHAAMNGLAFMAWLAFERTG